jgi:hypothetical protein
MKTKTIKAGTLKIDPKLTSLRHVNPFFVSRYRQSYRTGAAMPPLIVEKGTNRVVSGNHRLTAILEEFGKDKKVQVIEKEYASEKEVLEDFTRENASHGNPIDGFTRRNLINAMLKEGSTPEDVSKILNLPVSKIEQLGEDVVEVTVGKGKESRPKKRGFEPSRPISQDEYQEHVSFDRGVPIKQQVDQLIRWLDNGYVQRTDRNVQLIEQLREAAHGWLSNTNNKKQAV